MRSGIVLLARQLRNVRQYSTQVSDSQAVNADVKGKGRANYNVIEELESRGFVSALTHPQLKEHVTSPTCIYAGVDPSASSLHVGNLVALMGLLHFRLAGHKVLALIGGATGSIGDPSGRSTERQALSQDVLDANVKGITAQVHQFFERGEKFLATQDSGNNGRITLSQGGAKGEVKVLNNLDWFKGMGFLEFLRDVGKLAKVSTMLARDSVKNRLDSESGISFTEFSYQLLQAYDFSILNRLHGCRIQLGGSDQWGNIVAGIDLIKRQRSVALTGSILDDESPALRRTNSGEKESADKEGVYGITMPLLTNDAGEKFGKSAGNAVWLDPSRTSVSDFYQFFLRLPDHNIEAYLKYFTLLPLERIEEIMKEHSRKPKIGLPRRVLAEEVTQLVHGRGALERAQGIAKLLYRMNPRKLNSQYVLDLLAEEPYFRRVDWKNIRGQQVHKLATTYGLCRSVIEAKRAIKDRAAYVNGRPLVDIRSNQVKLLDIVDNHILVIQLGKRRHLVLFVEQDHLPRLEVTPEGPANALDWLRKF